MSSPGDLKMLHRSWLERLLPGPIPYPRPRVLPSKRLDGALLARWFSASHVLHQDLVRELPKGPTGVARMLTRLLASFSSFLVDIEAQVAQGNIVVTRFSGRAQQTGPIGVFHATGAWVFSRGMIMIRFEGQTALETWLEIDAKNVMTALRALDEEQLTED